MIPVFDRAKAVHALDRAATVIGLSFISHPQNPSAAENEFITHKYHEALRL
jgi:hypothetical protein